MNNKKGSITRLMRSYQMNEIHHTAIVSTKAILGENNYIGPYCIIGDGAIIGNNNLFLSHVSIASIPEHREYSVESTAGETFIGNNNVFKEFSVVSAPYKEKTLIENGCYFCKGSYIGHDSHIESNVTFAANALIGGFVYLMEGAYLGLNANVHQGCTVGSYSLLGMSCVVNKKTKAEPFKIYAGNPARYLKENTVGIERNNLTDLFMAKERDRYKFIVGLL